MICMPTPTNRCRCIRVFLGCLCMSAWVHTSILLGVCPVSMVSDKPVNRISETVVDNVVEATSELIRY